MKTNFFLIVNSRGTARVKQSCDNLAANEVAVGIVLNIPDAAFAKPKFSAVITVPDDAISPLNIPSDVQDNIAGAIKAAAAMECIIEFKQIGDE